MYFLAKLLSGCAVRSVGELLYKQVIKRGRRDTIIAGANYSAPSRDFPISRLPPKQDVPLYGSTFPRECNTLSERRSSPTEAAAGEGQPSAPQLRTDPCVEFNWKERNGRKQIKLSFYLTSESGHSSHQQEQRILELLATARFASLQITASFPQQRASNDFVIFRGQHGFRQ